ncbi:thioredoxin family protein [Paenibacillus sp. NPDC057934]|uniref:thioredoxin family protein n=1 Tax=Paenibacillus sp. NPDC057934 TaxID=3346282 RepID=UPI0036D7EC68
MKEITEITSIEMADDFLEKHELSFLDVSRPECSVCHAILPKLRELLDAYPEIHLGHIDANVVEEVASQFLIFTVPVMLLMAGQREYIRADRFVVFDRLREQLDQIYMLVNEEE